MNESAYRISNKKEFIIGEYFGDNVSADDVTWVNCYSSGTAININKPFEENGSNIGACLSLSIPDAKEYVVLDFSDESESSSLKEYSYISYKIYGETEEGTETVDMLNPMTKVQIIIPDTVEDEETGNTIETPKSRRFYIIAPEMSIYCVFIQTVINSTSLFTRAYLMNGGRFDVTKTSNNMIFGNAAMRKISVIRPVKLLNQVFNVPSDQMNTVKTDGHRVGAFYPYKKIVYRDIKPADVAGRKSNMFLFEGQEVQISASTDCITNASNYKNIFQYDAANTNGVLFTHMTGYIFTPVPNYDLIENMAPASIFLYSQGDKCPECGEYNKINVNPGISYIDGDGYKISDASTCMYTHNYGEAKCKCSDTETTYLACIPTIVAAQTYKVTKIVRYDNNTGDLSLDKLRMTYYLKPITA
jgi:hypothetical protein